MRHQYITHYEIWKDGQAVGWGNQALNIDCPYTPDATLFYEEVRADAAKQGGHDISQVRILGVFKL